MIWAPKLAPHVIVLTASGHCYRDCVPKEQAPLLVRLSASDPTVLGQRWSTPIGCLPTAKVLHLLNKLTKRLRFSLRLAGLVRVFARVSGYHRVLVGFNSLVSFEGIPSMVQSSRATRKSRYREPKP